MSSLSSPLRYASLGHLALACVIGAACTPSDTPTPDKTAAKTEGANESVGESKPSEPTPEPGEVEPTPDIGETGELAEPTPEPGALVPAAPADYGVFKFAAVPTEDELTHHALAGFEIVAIFAEPNKDATHLGFMRIGTRLRVGKKTVTPDCAKGWYALEGGGWACASRGLVVESGKPFMSYQPMAARTDSPFPYDWAYVREWNTPMWWQIPSAAALAATREQRAVLEALRNGEPPPGTEPEPAGDTGAEPAGDGGGDDGAGLPTVDPEPDADPEPTPEPEPEPEPKPEPEEEKEPIKIPLSPSTPWLEKGYYVSVGETIKEGGQSYWRTARGGIIEKSRAYQYTPKDYHGAAIHPGMSFPVGFVMAKDGTRLLELGADDKLSSAGKLLEKRAFLDLGEEVEIAGRTYFTVIPYSEEPPAVGAEPIEPTGEQPQLLVKADVLRLPDLQPVPKGLDPWDRWVDVDITKQIMVAYEGATPVYVTLVSTGKKGTVEERFDTPPGRYRIYSKQITSNMDGATATDGNYAIQDVPWVMYFEGSYALHGAFWHSSFGYVRSHGCVNLGPTDARWLFYWTTPFLPQYWHGVTATDENPGTTVIVRES